MENIKRLNILLKENILYFEIFVFTIIIILLYYKVIYTIHNQYFQKNNKKTKVQLIKAISLSLTFILCSEILKFAYIKTYKQLIIVTSLVILKLIMHYFLSKELEHEKQIKDIHGEGN